MKSLREKFEQEIMDSWGQGCNHFIWDDGMKNKYIDWLEKKLNNRRTLQEGDDE